MCNAGAGLIKEDGPVYYCFSSGVHPAPGSWIYSSSFSTVDMVATSVRYLRESGMTKIATLTTTDASGQDGDRTIDEALGRPENKGVAVDGSRALRARRHLRAAQLTRIKSSGAQAIIAWTSGTPFGTVLRGVRDGGYDLPVITTPANLVYKQLDQYKSVMPTLPVVSPGNPERRSGGDRRPRRTPFDRSVLRGDEAARRCEARRRRLDRLGRRRIVVEGYRKLGLEATPAQMRDYINNTRNWSNVLGDLRLQELAAARRAAAVALDGPLGPGKQQVRRGQQTRRRSAQVSDIPRARAPLSGISGARPEIPGCVAGCCRVFVPGA